MEFSDNHLENLKLKLPVLGYKLGKCTDWALEVHKGEQIGLITSRMNPLNIQLFENHRCTIHDEFAFIERIYDWSDGNYKVKI